MPGTLQEGGAPFVSTRWSLVAQAAGDLDDPATAQRALAELYRAYWPPIYTFVRRRGYPASDAQDLTQAFFLHLLGRQTHARADPARGKFRTFLLAALKNFLADAQARAATVKRGGRHEFLPLDEALAEAEQATLLAGSPSSGGEQPGPGQEDWSFEARWAATLVGRALRTLQTEFMVAGRGPLFDALRPFLGGGAAPVPDQGELAARLGMPVNTLRIHVHRLRERYRAALREEVIQTVASEDEVNGELQHLFRVLIRS